MGYRDLFLPMTILATCIAATAQSTSYGLGRTPTAGEIRAWNITISIEGKELPAGSGSADPGEKIYVQKCAACHGLNGRDGLAPALVISKDPAAPPRQRRVLVTRVPFPVMIWDYINRAMPMLMGPGTLTPDEVYSLTAYLFYKNDVINENDILNDKTLPKVRMPNHDGYVPPVIADLKAPISKPLRTTRATLEK